MCTPIVAMNDILHITSGFLFRAQPTLMTLESSTAIMDTIFASNEEDQQGRLLKIIQDFLMSEAAKHAAKEKGAQIPHCSSLILKSSLHQRLSVASQRTLVLTWRSWLETQAILRTLGKLYRSQTSRIL